MEVTLETLERVAGGELLYYPRTAEEMAFMRLYARTLELSTDPTPVMNAGEVVATFRHMASDMAAYIREHEGGRAGVTHVHTAQIPRGGARLAMIWYAVTEELGAKFYVHHPFDVAISHYGRRGTEGAGQTARRVVLPLETQARIHGNHVYAFEDIIDRGDTAKDAAQDLQANGATDLRLMGFVGRKGNEIPAGDGLEVIGIANMRPEREWFDGAWCMDLAGYFRSLAGLHIMHDHVVRSDVSGLNERQEAAREKFQSIVGYMENGRRVEGELDRLRVNGVGSVEFAEDRLPPMIYEQIMKFI